MLRLRLDVSMLNAQTSSDQYKSNKCYYTTAKNNENYCFATSSCNVKNLEMETLSVTLYNNGLSLISNYAGSNEGLMSSSTLTLQLLLLTMETILTNQ